MPSKIIDERRQSRLAYWIDAPDSEKSRLECAVEAVKRMTPSVALDEIAGRDSVQRNIARATILMCARLTSNDLAGFEALIRRNRV